MKLAEFVGRLKDDCGRFRIAYERARARHPKLLDEDQADRAWLAQFLLWRESERAQERTPRSGE